MISYLYAIYTKVGNNILEVLILFFYFFEGVSLMYKKLVLFLGMILIFNIYTSNAFAYDPYSASAYADRWAKSRNSNYPANPSDCTNFVSQAIHDPSGGNKPYDKSGLYYDQVWYCGWNGSFYWSNSWAVADSFKDYLLDNPAGWTVGAWGPYQPNTTAETRNGDVIFYDWESNGIMNHAGFKASWGTDPEKYWTGDLVDTHTADHYHAIWHLIPYNAQWVTTTVVAVRPY